MRRDRKLAKIAAQSSSPQNNISWLVVSIRPRSMWFSFDGTVYLEPRGGQNNRARTTKGKKLKQTGHDSKERKNRMVR